MQKVRYISLIVLFILILYLSATALFAWFFRVRSVGVQITRTPAPTFTPVPALLATAVVIIPTATTLPTAIIPPTALPSPAPPADTPTPLPPTLTPTPVGPQLLAANTVNVRSGPGTDYPVVASLPANLTVPITGRNNEASWWQISNTDGATGWVAGSVVQVNHSATVPVVAAPPPPASPTPEATPTPEKPKYQFEPTGWFNDTNYGLTRFLGNITDAAGNPVNGVYVQASCGGFSVISNPSGPVGGLNGGGAFWPPGFYDLTLDTKPIPCKWILSVVATDDQRTVKATLSEPVEIEVTYEKSIVTANWRKNW